MPPLPVPYTTNEYVKVPLTQWTSAIADPTTLPVQLAFVAPGHDPAPIDWQTAQWITESGVHKARIQWQTAVPNSGPGMVYAVWMQITANPEVIVLYAGAIRTL